MYLLTEVKIKIMSKHKYFLLLTTTAVLGSFLISNSLAAYSQSSETDTSIRITAGDLTLYSGDNTSNSDICSNSDITSTIDNPTSPIVIETINCDTSENSISLGSINTIPTRQNPSTLIHDVLFDDLRGLSVSNYTVTAEVSNFIDINNTSNVITLGSNPDGATATLDAGTITIITIDNGGSGYDTAPLITLVGGGGSGASAEAIVANGIITKINVQNLGTGYTSSPAVVIVPLSGGSGAIATANIIEKDSNLNLETSLPEANIFVTLDPSVGSVSKLKPELILDTRFFTTGPRALVTSPNSQFTLFRSVVLAPTGRYKLDNTIFGLRTPAYLSTGDYRATIVQTIIADSQGTYQNPVAGDNSIGPIIPSSVADMEYAIRGPFNGGTPNSLKSVKILSLPDQGTLKLNGTNVVLNQIINADPFNGTNDLNGLSYEATNSTYDTSFTWTGFDGTNYSNISTIYLYISQ
jgi:hypothetical protein